MPETRSTTTPANVKQSLQYTLIAPGVVFRCEFASPAMTAVDVGGDRLGS